MSNSEMYQRVAANPKFAALVSRRSRFGLALAALVLTAYYGLMLAVAFLPGMLARPLAAGSAVTVGVPLVAGIFIGSWLLMGVYVWRANGEFDALSDALVQETAR